MLSILVTNVKGGCGKTTVATNLATAWAAVGRVTALAEADRQRSAAEWLARRPTTAPVIRAVDWRKTCERVPRDVERLVIDAPAGVAPKRVEELLRRADIVLVPVTPSIFDAGSTARFIAKLLELKPIRKSRASVGLVVNRLRSRARSSESVEAFVTSLGKPILARLSDRAAYPELAARGLGLFDPGAAVGPALRSEWRPLLTALEAMNRED
jgi:chromosome partitioning protein